MSSKRNTLDGFALNRPAATFSAMVRSGTSERENCGTKLPKKVRPTPLAICRSGVEVSDRGETTQPASEAGATTPAEHPEGIKDGAVADQVKHRINVLRFGDSL